MDSNKTQFSIYKIDVSLFSDIREIKLVAYNNHDEKNNLIIKYILEYIKKEISKKRDFDFALIDSDGIKGVVYQTTNLPDWVDIINNLVDKNNTVTLENINVSYILFYSVNENIYAMTAGFGSHLIKNYIEKSWGLYLLPKLLESNEGVIRELKENNFYGNTLHLSKANRNRTNIIYEKKMSSIFKELSIEINSDIAIELGLSDKKDNRKTGVLLKDSLNVKRSIAISKLKNVLNKIYYIEQREPKYSLGYIVPAGYLGIKKSDLYETLINNILNDKIDNFVIIGDDYSKYCVGATDYIIKNEKNEIFYESDTSIEFKDLIDKIKESKKISKNMLNNFLKRWTISTNDVGGNEVLYPTYIQESLQGFIEYGEKNIPCYLMQGEWYCFDYKSESILQKEFKERYDAEKTIVNEIKEKFSLTADNKTENDYNDDFFERDDVINAHRSNIHNVEIADLIFWDEENIYLMCNKSKFNAEGSRDLTNQMWVSANYLQIQLRSNNRDDFLEEYYDCISKRYLNEKNIVLPIKKEEFKNAFKKNKVYIAGYMESYSPKSQSVYAKYLTIDTYKKMEDMSYKFYSMNILNEV